MFAPTRVWRRWHRHTNLNQKRYAVASAVAASALPSLVMARGHRIDKVNEVPLVVSNEVESFCKTKQAVELLKKINAYADVERVVDSKKLRAGRGKSRNRRHTQRRGPLVIYGNDNGLVKAFRNIPGVDLANVSDLNLLKLAPGGHVGRFIVWTKSAFEQLDKLFGTYKSGSEMKKNYVLPQPLISNPDITRIINSNEIQSALNPAKTAKQKRAGLKKNPLRNRTVLLRLNPYAKAVKKAEAALVGTRKQKKAEKVVKARAFEAVLKA